MIVEIYNSPIYSYGGESFSRFWWGSFSLPSAVIGLEALARPVNQGQPSATFSEFRSGQALTLTGETAQRS
jgi:hypothetical protein